MIRLLSLRMAYRHVRAGLGRMFLSVVAVALGVALVVAVKLMNAAVLESFLGTADAMAGRAALTVGARDGASFADEVRDRVATVRGVKLAVPLVKGVAFPDDGSGVLLSVHGVDLANESEVRLYHDPTEADEVIDDPFLFLNQPDSIVLGKEFAEERGLEKEDKINLVTPKGVMTFTVRGLLEPQGLARTLRGRLVVMDRFAAERIFTANQQINQIDLVLEDGWNVEETREAVAEVLPAGLIVETPALRKDVIRKTVGGFQSMIIAFSLLAVLAGFVICYSRLGAVFEARTWEIGLFRAVGLRQPVVFWELLKESLLLGLLGTGLGIALGTVIGRYGLPYLAATTAIGLRLPEPSAEVTVRTQAYLLGGLVGVLGAVAAAAIPALRLARTQPVAALTMRGREIQAQRPHRRWLWPAMLVLLIAGLITCQYLTHVTVLGNVTTGLMAMAVALAAAPLVTYGSGVAMAILQRAFGPIGRFAGGHVGRQPRRTALTVATLGLGLGAVLLFGMLGWSFERTLVSQLTRRYSSDLAISSAFVSGGYRSSSIDEGIVEDLSGTKGIAVAIAEQQRDVDYANEWAALCSYDPPCFTDLRVCNWQVDSGALPDALGLVARGEAAMVSSSFAYQNGTAPGDLITLPTPHGPHDLRVAAVTNGQSEDAIIISRDVYRQLWNDRSVWLVHATIANGASLKEVERRVSQQLGEKYRIHVQSSQKLIEYFAGQVREAFSFLYLMEAIIFVLVLVGIGDTLISGVVERTREFGMMRAVGLSRARLFLIVMLEGCVIGCIGFALAMGAGFAMGVFWTAMQFPAIVGFKLDLYVPWSFVLTAGVLTMGLCLLGSLLPSIRAANISVSEALRNE